MLTEKNERAIFIVRLSFILLTLVWMIVIFSFSAKNDEVSAGESNKVAMTVGAVIHKDFNSWLLEEKKAFIKKWDTPIRKTAHIIEYVILGFLVMGAFAAGRTGYKSSVIKAFAIALIYAVSDEVHQLFVPGRGCSIIDVCIDAAGIAAGVALGYLLLHRLNRRIMGE